MTDRSYRITLGVAYALGVCALLMQTLWAVLSPEYNGLLPYRGADESIYLIHLQEGLIDPWADTTNGIWRGVHNTTGLQSALMERVAGWMFGWTGLNAYVVSTFLTAFVGPTVMLLMASLLRKAGSSRWQALVLAILFFIVTGMTRRFFNPSVSLPLLLLALLQLWRWWEHLRIRDALLLGIILGIHVGVYFWSWTFSWAVFGLMSLFIVEQWKQPDARTRLVQYVVAGITALLAGMPMLLRLWKVLHHPLYDESSLRMGLLYAREVESIPRSVLLAFFAVGTVWALRTAEDRKRFAPLIAMAVASFVVMHQQFVHGKIMSFSSHYYFYICVAATLVLGCLIARRTWTMGAGVAAVASVVFLGGAWNDYYGRLALLLPPPSHMMTMQHLAPAVERMQHAPREMVLTDRTTANQFAAVTDDDVLFTDYSRILLVSDQEYIERYCLSEALSTSPIDSTYIPWFNEEQSRAATEQTARIKERYTVMAKDICERVDTNIPLYLARYEVTTVLWNEREKPDWDVQQPYLTLREKGEGWSVYDVSIARL